MNDPRKQPIFTRGNGGTAVAKPAPAPAAKKEPPKQDVLLRLWMEQGTKVTVHFVDSSELTGKVLQVEMYAFSLLTEAGPAQCHKVAVAWTRAENNPGS